MYTLLIYLLVHFTSSFHLFISLVHFTYSYVYSSISLVHFTCTLYLLISFVHFTRTLHLLTSFVHFTRPFHYFTLSISPGITPGSMPPNSRSLHEEGATFISFFIVRNGEFKEKGNIYIFTFIQFISKYGLHSIILFHYQIGVFRHTGKYEYNTSIQLIAISVALNCMFNLQNLQNQ